MSPTRAPRAPPALATARTMPRDAPVIAATAPAHVTRSIGVPPRSRSLAASAALSREIFEQGGGEKGDIFVGHRFGTSDRSHPIPERRETKYSPLLPSSLFNPRARGRPLSSGGAQVPLAPAIPSWRLERALSVAT